MHFKFSLASSLAGIALLYATVAAAYPTSPASGPVSADYYSLGCPTNTTKPWASQREQLDAITNYYNLLFSGQAVKAFDTYTAERFINHAPDVTGDGRTAALTAIGHLLSQSTEVIQKIFAGPDADGTDYGHVYFKGINKLGVGAIMEYWRFAGNCLVEHWNIAEQASGVNSTNPKAFF